MDCIYFVDRSELPLLEFIMKGCKRENVAIMANRSGVRLERKMFESPLAGALIHTHTQGSSLTCECPFERAGVYARARFGKVEEAVRSRRAGRVAHDHALAAAIAGAWLELPDEVRDQGWPNWGRIVLEG